MNAFLNSLLQNMKDEIMFGYRQCDLIVADELKAKSSNSPPTFKNINVTRKDIGNL